MGQAAQADQAGGGELKAAYDRLSAASKAVLNRLKAGEANVSKEEWAALRRELRDAGLITQEEFFRSDPDVVVVGYTDANGELVTYPPVCCQGAAQSNGGVLISRYWSPEDWAGDPLRFLDKWLEAIREWQDEVDAQYRAAMNYCNGTGGAQRDEKLALDGVGLRCLCCPIIYSCGSLRPRPDPPHEGPLPVSSGRGPGARGFSAGRSGAGGSAGAWGYYATGFADAGSPDSLVGVDTGLEGGRTVGPVRLPCGRSAAGGGGRAVASRWKFAFGYYPSCSRCFNWETAKAKMTYGTFCGDKKRK